MRVLPCSITSIQIEGGEDDHPRQVNKVPVQTKVFDALTVFLIEANGVGFEDEVEHHQEPDKDVESVGAGGDVEDGTLLRGKGEALSDEVAPLDEFQHDEEGAEGQGRDEVVPHSGLARGHQLRHEGV